MAGNETDVYDIAITIADFSTEPARIIFQKQGRTKTVSEIPHIYVKEAMEAASLAPGHAEVTMRADNDIAVEGDVAAQVVKLLDMLEDLDDVQAVYSNADLAGHA